MSYELLKSNDKDDYSNALADNNLRVPPWMKGAEIIHCAQDKSFPQFHEETANKRSFNL